MMADEEVLFDEVYDLCEEIGRKPGRPLDRYNDLFTYVLYFFRSKRQRRSQRLSAAAGNLAVAQYAKRRSRAAFDAELFWHPLFFGRLRCKYMKEMLSEICIAAHTNCRMYPVFSSVCAAYFPRAQHVTFLSAHLTDIFWSVRPDITGKFTVTTFKPSSVFAQMELGKRPLDRRRN
ncbi:hypothetical protein HUJ05_011935 [Dendroctonus ponderosae]|nr:hypothetical protein HUJ05_011935 [Dendroctonus ponderosae]